jgi:hypothetical protein
MANKLYSDWETTGNTVVDMVATAVAHYRKIYKPLKTIRLHAFLFHKFEVWVSKQMNEEEFEQVREHGYQFDGVNVELASIVQASNMAFEFYNDGEQI